MDGPGTVTWEEFLADAEDFIRVSDAIGDCWILRGDKDQPAGAYLARRERLLVPSDHFPEDGAAAVKDDWSEDSGCALDDDPFEARSGVERPFVVEHHILWSISYGVPVLYFNGWKSDFPGVNPIAVELAQRMVPQHGALSYAELSQAIHPILGTPFLQLHPCMSRELLRSTGASGNKLVSWLSATAPAALKLKMKPEYCELALLPRRPLLPCKK